MEPSHQSISSKQNRFEGQEQKKRENKAGKQRSLYLVSEHFEGHDAGAPPIEGEGIGGAALEVNSERLRSWRGKNDVLEFRGIWKKAAKAVKTKIDYPQYARSHVWSHSKESIDASHHITFME